MLFLLIPALLCVAWAVVAAMLIVRDLQKRGIPVSYIWLRFMILKYLHQYAKITREQDGHVGTLFYHYVVPLNIALVFIIVFAIVAR